MRILFVLILFIFLSQTIISQKPVPAVMDTIETSNGIIVLYKNFTWDYLENEPVMMSSEDDSTGLFKHEWVNDQVFAHRVLPDSVRDTVVSLISKDRTFILPGYGRLFRGFTYTHKGLDIGLRKGDSVKAAFDGVVRYAKYNRGGFGNLVILRHFNGLETYYAHLSKLKVQVNQVVKAGDIVGLAGSTGRSRSPHLHFEVRYKDVPMDPMRMLDFDHQCLICDTLSITKMIFFPSDYDGKAVYYKIKSGDTLGKVAKKYRTSVKELCALNKIKTTTNLKIGRPIRVK
jgi:murein DD-endopeptidase MepM/ murein hydrolase activator NlpD